MKRETIITAILSALAAICWNPAFADENAPSENRCSEVKDFWIIGPDEVKIGTSQEYLALPMNEKIKDGDRIVYELWKGGTMVESVEKEKYLRFFSEAWSVRIRAILTRRNECFLEAEKTVRIYAKALAYVGDGEQLSDVALREWLKQRSVLLRETGIPTSSAIPWSKDFASLLEKHKKELNEADYVIINAKRPAEFFEAAARMVKESEEASAPFLQGKEVYVVDGGNGYLLSLTVAWYAEQLWMDKMYALNEKNVSNLLMLLNVAPRAWDTLWSEIDFWKTSGGSEFRKAFNRIAYAGFPISFVGFLLSLLAASLVLAIFRQVAGFYTFGTFWPLFLIVSISATNAQNVAVLLVSGIIANALVEKTFAKFRISYWARKTLALGIYALIAIVMLSWMKWAWAWDNLEMYANQVAILPFVLVLLVAEKLYGEGMSWRPKESLIAIAQFATVCATTYGVLESQWIRNALLSYPETVFAILAAIVFVWRYSWLQVTEYYRFLPIIRERFSETKKEE